MEQQQKQRTVGAVVLGALALILVPIVLDFSKEERAIVQHQAIPPAPDVMKMEVLPLDVWSAKEDPQIDTANRIIEQPTPEPEPVAEPVIETQTTQSQPKSKPELQPAAAPKPVSAQPEPKQASIRSDKPVPEIIPKGAAAWVVQVASFNDEPKAFALRDKLRDGGMTSFIERARADGRLIYRVKVGPVLQRDEADRLQKRIAEQVRLTGLVMQYR